jgi:type VI secretion system protein ImpK
VETLREKARDEGMSQRDADDAAYAVVALIDEVAQSKPEPLRGYWMSRPLQLHYFNENVAGEGFFNKLTELRRDVRRHEVLRIYYQCLLLGFQGQYSMRGGELELMKIIESVKPEVEKHIEPPDPLAPSGEPPDEAMVRASGRNPFLWVALGMFAVAIAVFIGLRVSLDRSVADLAARVEELRGR